MGVSVKLKSKVYADGTQPVMIRIYVDGKTTYKSMNPAVAVKKELWDSKNQRVKTSHPTSEYYNTIISNERNKYEKMYFSAMIENNAAEMEQIFEKPVKSVRVADLFPAYLDYLQCNKAIASFRKSESALKLLESFLKDIRLSNINDRYIDKIVHFLRVVHGNSNTSIHHKIKLLTTVVNKHLGKRRRHENPFFGYEVKKDAVNRPKLNREELARIEELEFSNSPILEASRDIFLFQVFAHGVRIWDALNIKFSDIKEGWLIYSQHKTGNNMEVELHPKLLAIIEKYKCSYDDKKIYIFPFLNSRVVHNDQAIFTAVSSSTSLINKNLKKIAARAGIVKNLTTHIARHSFATIADELITDKRSISASLGHSRFKTTEMYLAEVSRRKQNEVNSIFYN